MQIPTTLKEAQKILQGRVPHPRSSAEIILAHVLGRPREWLITHPEHDFDPGHYLDLIHQHRAGKPLAHILGHQDFYGRHFTVTPEVLIPRPETESIITHTLPELRNNDKVIDIGTGSGAIAITLKLEKPTIEMHATDISPTALEIARQNAQTHQAEVNFHHTDQFFPSHTPFDIIVTNLPYIPTTDPSIQKSVVEHEPALALYGGNDGLDHYRDLFHTLSQKPWHPRFLMLEMGYNQAKKLTNIIHSHFPAAHIQTLSDHSGFDRNLIIRFN